MNAHNETRPVGIATLADLVQAIDGRNPLWRKRYTEAKIEWAIQAAWILASVPPLAAITGTGLVDIEGRAGRLLEAGR